ncbi:hypothetical protein [Parerythrobacter aestuarii]|uniref:hypothetical protein n=1 Tax=Parerythrobacter aestuarii TaxID=3020909 RepID=UPI0024DE7128|nr:hypothetical protein [Parerythrobacter aestuarii]
MRVLIAGALLASLFYLAAATAEYRAYWDQPEVRQRFAYVRPEIVEYLFVHAVIPLVLAIYPRRITNLVFWALALYLPIPWLQAALDDGHTVNQTVVNWYLLNGLLMFAVAGYTASRAISGQTRGSDA